MLPANVGMILQEGIVIMIVGMGIVFAFLTVLVASVEITHMIIERLNIIFPPKVAEPAKKSANTAEDELIAIAVAASRI